MKRDELPDLDRVVLPIETDRPPTTAWKLDPVREGMNHYYNRDAGELRRLLEKLASERDDKTK